MILRMLKDESTTFGVRAGDYVEADDAAAKPLLSLGLAEVAENQNISADEIRGEFVGACEAAINGIN